MRTLTLLPIFTISLLISGCGQKAPCPERECYYPELPTYRVGDSNKLLKVVPMDGNRSIVINSELLRMAEAKARYKRIVVNTNLIHRKVNNEYKSERLDDE